MKRSITLLFLSISIISTNALFGQNVSNEKLTETGKWYFKTGFAYGLPFSRMRIDEDYDLRYSMAVDIVYEEHTVLNSSFGKGYYGNITAGYNLAKNFSVELGAVYLYGLSRKTTDVVHFYWGDATTTHTYDPRMLAINPNLLIKANASSRTPYFKMGALFAFPSVSNEYNYRDYTGIYESEKRKYKGTMSIGATAAAGVNWFLSGKWNLYTEMYVTYLKFSPTSSETFEYTVQGADSLGTLTQSRKKTIYKDEYTIKYKINSTTNKLEETYDKSSPLERGRFDLPFGSWGLNVGVKYNF